jgi:cytochrome c-type protein NapB
MRGADRAGVSRALLVVLLAAAGCGDGAPGSEARVPQSDAEDRAARRAYDGAPPVAGHADFGMTCTTCHDERGQAVKGVGFAPASPHDGTAQAPFTARCRQCHVFPEETGVFVENDFVGLQQDLRTGERLNSLAPPTIPHRLLMRENCLACHAGPGARPEIATGHPERERCRQCHVPVTTRSVFDAEPGPAPGRDDHANDPEGR